MDAVYAGAAAPSAGEAVAVPAQAAPELRTQTLDVSSYSGLR